MSTWWERGGYGPDWPSFSQACRRNFPCSICHSRYRVELAHLVAVRKMPKGHPFVRASRNLVILCHSCHRTFDSLVGSWHPTPEQRAWCQQQRPRFKHLLVKRIRLVTELIEAGQYFRTPWPLPPAS